MNPEPFQPKGQNLYEDVYTQCFGRYEFQLVTRKKAAIGNLKWGSDYVQAVMKILNFKYKGYEPWKAEN